MSDNGTIDIPHAALERIHNVFYSAAAVVCEDGQAIEPQLSAYRVTNSGQVEHHFSFPANFVRSAFHDEGTKRGFAAMLRAFADPANPVTVGFTHILGFVPNLYVQVNEAWTVKRDAGFSPDLVVSEQPDRAECVLISLHVGLHTVSVFHEIATTPRRHLVRSPFLTPEAADHIRGRFVLHDPTHGAREKGRA